VLLLLCLQLEGFRNRQLRPSLAQMLGLEENNISPGRVSYELRRLPCTGSLSASKALIDITSLPKGCARCSSINAPTPESSARASL
jgi:hypothetical protein